MTTEIDLEELQEAEEIDVDVNDPEPDPTALRRLSTSFTEDYALTLSQEGASSPSPDSQPKDLTILIFPTTRPSQGSSAAAPFVYQGREKASLMLTAKEEKERVDELAAALNGTDEQKQNFLRDWAKGEEAREQLPYLYSQAESLQRILDALTDLTKDPEYPKGPYDEKIVQVALTSMHRTSTSRLWRTDVPEHIFALVRAWQDRDSSPKMTYLLECLISVLDTPLTNEKFLSDFIPLLLPFLKTKISELQMLLAFLLRSVVLTYPNIMASHSRAFGETVEAGITSYLFIVRPLHEHNRLLFDDLIQEVSRTTVSVLEYALGTYSFIPDDTYWKECVNKFFSLRQQWQYTLMDDETKT